MPPTAADRLALAAAFVDTARRYWLTIYPAVSRELRNWSLRAAAIPDPTLRGSALGALTFKRGHPEGAAAFATLAPPAHRTALVRALVAFQMSYDYLDLVSERPGGASPANARQLHLALLAALDPDAREPDYYALNAARDDGGYLDALVAACRSATESLPCYATIGARARRFARLIVGYQSLNAQPTPTDSFARWADEQAPPRTDLRWWEAAAAAGSSLPVLALLAAAADPTTDECRSAAVEATYFPWIAALHSLLDSLIDRAEDQLAGHHSLIGHYSCECEAASRLAIITSQSRDLVRQLPQANRHAAILRGMAAHYLAAPQASLPGARPARDAVLAALQDLTTPPLLVFRLKRQAPRAARLRRR